MTSDLIREVEAQEAKERAKVEALLGQIYRARQAAKLDGELSPVVRQWLELNGGESLVDGEGGYTGELSRTSRTVWDLRPLTDAQVLYLARAGLLTVSTGAFDALRKAAPSVLLDSIVNTPGVRTTNESSALQVKQL